MYIYIYANLFKVSIYFVSSSIILAAKCNPILKTHLSYPNVRFKKV